MPDLIIVIVVVSLLVGVVIAFIALFWGGGGSKPNPEYVALTERVSRATNVTFTPTKSPSRFQGSWRGRTFELDWNDSSGSFTILLIGTIRLDADVYVVLMPRSVAVRAVTPMVRTLMGGVKDIQTGDAAFDARYAIMGKPKELVERALLNGVIDALMLLDEIVSGTISQTQVLLGSYNATVAMVDRIDWRGWLDMLDTVSDVFEQTARSYRILR